MAYSANQQQPFPYVPPSMSAGDRHEMRDYYPPQDAPRPTLNQSPHFKPYLGLRARLSQVWINRWTVLLLLVLVRLLFAIASTDDSLVTARREALSACTQVENIGSNLASMPHFMAKGVNELTASGVEKAVSALMKMLEMSITGVEEIILFVIHMMTSTYLCLITLAVSGSLGAAVELGNEINKKLDETINDVTEDMGNAVKKVTDGINSILDKINFALPDFAKPEINLDQQITKLKDLQLPPQMQQGLEKLNSSIPTFEDVQSFADDLIRKPFEEVKKLIQAQEKFEFDRQLFPVPAKESLNFCSEGNAINNFFDKLLAMGRKTRNIALALLVSGAIIACIPMAWMELKRYRKQKQRAALFREGHDEMDVVYLASRPTSSGIGLWFGKRFGSGHRQYVVRWAWAYATSIPMMFLLSLALAGLFSCFCQWLLLKSIQDKAPELTQEVADFAERVVKALNNASMSWSVGVNGAVGKLDDKINNDLLGWVGTSTSAVNNTLNGFVEKMSSTLNTTFGNTILYEPIKKVLNCLVGLKVASFQKGLTWVHDNAHVSFPGVPSDTFSLGALADKSGSSSAAELFANPNGKAKDEVSEAINRVIEKMLNGIKLEAFIALALMLIWLAIAIGGSVYAFTRLAGGGPSEQNDRPLIVRVNEPKSDDEYFAAPPNYAQAERMRSVSQHSVTSSSHRGHQRSSSHGDVTGPSPFDDHMHTYSEKR